MKPDRIVIGGSTETARQNIPIQVSQQRESLRPAAIHTEDIFHFASANLRVQSGSILYPIAFRTNPPVSCNLTRAISGDIRARTATTAVLTSPLHEDRISLARGKSSPVASATIRRAR